MRFRNLLRERTGIRLSLSLFFFVLASSITAIEIDIFPDTATPAGISAGEPTEAFPLMQHVYDADGDGIWDFFTRNSLRWDGEIVERSRLETDRVIVKSIYPIVGNRINYYKIGFRIDDLDRDGQLDFISDDFGICKGTLSEFIQTDLGVDLRYDWRYTINDLNGDGIKDVLIDKVFDLPSNELKMAVQRPDGTFVTEQLRVFTPEMLSDTLREFQSDGGRGVLAMDAASVLNGFKNNWYIPSSSGSVAIDPFNPLYAPSADFNKNGLMDVFGGKGLYSNLSGNRVLFQPIDARYIARDLNNDFITDFICVYDNSVSILLYDVQNGTFEREELVSDLVLDHRLYCYDFDRDGDIDILLPFSNTTPEGYAFLVFGENDGTGRFTNNMRVLHENVYARLWKFLDCADINNDGYYDMIVAEGMDKISVLWGKSGFTFDETPRQIPEAALKNTYGVLDIPALQLAYLGDFSRDGKYELLTNTNQVYPIPGATVNQRPQKPAAPTAVYDASSGVLRVNWQAGKDTESMPVELSYALRIGTTPQGEEILAGDALADGMRRNLLDGNMGYNLDRTFFTDSWGEGTFYIALQCIDPNRNGSAWSEPCKVQIERPRPLIRADKQRMSTGDTLSLYTLTPSRGTLAWSYPGGNLIACSSDRSRISLTWKEEGEKVVRLSHVIGSDSLHSELFVTLHPARFVQQTLPFGQLDIDQDGDLDQLSQTGGVSLNDGMWNLTRVPMLYNQNLTFGSYPQFIDFNFDGLPDILDETSKGNLLLNQGGGVFKIVKNNTPAGKSWYGKFKYFNYLDFDNDGKADYFDEGRETGFYDITQVYFNEGDYEQFTKMIPGNQIYSPIDWNKDGLWDLYFVSSYGGLSVCLNNGDRTFTQKEYVIDRALGAVTAVVDLNNDGYFDLVTENGVVLENRSNESFEERLRIRMPVNYDGAAIMVRGIADIDNNGYDDLLMYGGILYFYPAWAYAFVVNDWPVNFYPKTFYDRTGNGVPDLKDLRHISGITNTPPAAPAGLRAVQQEGCVKLSWEDASDRETPVKRMRYNVSLKKKGGTGANSFILSPLNGLKDAASIIPQHRYYESTVLSVPLRVLPEGEYELQVQAIDAWNSFSPMSEVLSFSVLANPALRLEEKICARYATTIIYTGNTGSGVTPQWDWDGGELLEQIGPNYRVIWTVAGTKNVVCRLGDREIRTPVYVKEPVADELEFPRHGFVRSETAMLLPAACLDPDIRITWYYRRQGASTYYPLPVERRGFTREARVRFTDKGLYDIKAVVDNGTCEPAEWLRQIEIHDALPVPQIAVVSVDAASGKYHVSWDERLWNKGQTLPAFVDEVIVYRQGSSLNDFREIARVPVARRGYLDLNAYPEMETPTYRLALSTSFGVIGTPGNRHTPPVLLLNKLAGGAWNISWNAYQGASIDYYRILRGTSPDELSEIGRVAGNYASWIDRSAPQEACYYALIYERYVDDWIEMRKASSPTTTGIAQLQIEGKSLVRSTAQGNELKLAAQLFIRSGEERDVLTPEQPTLALFADIQPVTASYKIVRWVVTQGSDIVTIDQNGVVRATGAGNGEVRIQASTIDGSDISREKVLTVRDYGQCVAPEVPLLEFGGDCYWTSYDAELTYTWYVDEVVVSQGKGEYKFDLQPGMHAYRVVVSNDCGLRATSETAVYELTGLTTKADDVLWTGPNPVGDLLYVRSANMAVERVVITDRQGRTIGTMKPDNPVDFVLPMASYEDGMYFIHFFGQQQTITRKLVKARN